MPVTVRNLKIVSNLFMITIIVLTFVDFFLNTNQLNSILNNIDMMNVNNNLRANF
jgi:hypothetical protein